MRILICSFLTLSLSILSQSTMIFAADQAKPVKTMSPELKMNMADMYQKMADCLKTDKSLDQCSKDVMVNCPVMAKTGHCPIHEGMGHMMGKKSKKSMPGMDMSKMNADQH